LVFLVSVGMAVGPVPAAVAGVQSAVLTATTYPSMGSVVIPNPLPNFTAAAPGPTNGALTATELGALSSNPQVAEGQFNVLAKQAGFGAYLRLWTDANGPGKGANDIVITLYRIPNSQDADSFASGSQNPYQQPGAASSFSVPSIPGAHGYTVSITSPTQVTEQVVLFKSDPYVAIVQLASSVAITNPAPLNPSDAITVSYQQYTAIRHFLGTPAGAPSGAATATAKSGSVLPTVLAVIAGLVVLAAVAWIAAGPPRERRRRRRTAMFAPSHEARVAAPIDVPVAETRPVRLARGPVIRVVEVDPGTGSVVSPPKAVPAKAAPRPMSAARSAPPPASGARPVPVVEPEPTPAWTATETEPEAEAPVEAVVGAQPVFEPTIEPGPGAGAGPGAVPDLEPEPAFETKTAPEFEPIVAPGPERSAEPWLEVQAGARLEPAFARLAEPDLEELELAESAAALLAAQELAELGSLAEPLSLKAPEAIPDHVVEPPMVPPVHPLEAGQGSGQTPVGRFDDPAPGTPAGWLPDPSGLPEVLRYWDGHAWTFHVATRAVKH
jgi:hypothetical protein